MHAHTRLELWSIEREWENQIFQLKEKREMHIAESSKPSARRSITRLIKHQAEIAFNTSNASAKLIPVMGYL